MNDDYIKRLEGEIERLESEVSRLRGSSELGAASHLYFLDSIIKDLIDSADVMDIEWLLLYGLDERDARECRDRLRDRFYKIVKRHEERYHSVMNGGLYGN